MTLQPTTPYGSTDVVEVLDRVLDKGLVVMGDISISVANLELLGLRLRLLLTSLDRAEELGVDLSWTGLDRARALPSQERHALASEAEERRVLSAPAGEQAIGSRAGERALGVPSEAGGPEIAPAQLERLHRRLAELEHRLAQRTAGQAADRSPQRTSN
jgi:hypothetical protein